MGRKNTLRPIAAIEWSPTGIRLADGRVVPPGANGVPSPAVVALSRRSVFVRSVRVPNVAEEAVRQALIFQIGQMFPVDAGQTAWDFVLGSHTDSEGRVASVFGCQNTTLQEATAELHQRSVRTTAVVPIALGSILIAKTLALPTCALVEQLPDGFGIDIIHEGALKSSRVVGPGVSLVTECALAMASASVPTGPIVGCGGLAAPGIELTTDLSQLDMLASPDAVQLDVHLEHPELAAERASRRSKTRLRQAILMAAAAALLWTMILVDAADRNKALSSAETRWNVRLNKLRKTRSTVESDLTKVQKKEAVIDRAFSPAQPVSDVMSTFAQSVPASAWLTGISFERGKVVNLRGTAMDSESVGSLVQRMSALNRFRDVRLLFANKTEVESTPIVQFAVGLHVVGNLPLSTPEKTKKGARR